MDQGGKKAEELRHKLLLLPKPKPTSGKAEQPEQDDVKPSSEEKPKKGKSGKGKSPPSVGSSSSTGKDYDKGLEKASAEKDRLLDYQRNRYVITV